MFKQMLICDNAATSFFLDNLPLMSRENPQNKDGGTFSCVFILSNIPGQGT